MQHDSSDSIAPLGKSAAELPQSARPDRTRQVTDSESSTGSNFFTGVLHKRRRKKHQGYARRFFSLDYTSSTLSYYHNRNTLALRGAVPLYLAAIGANADTRQISIDSGVEIWHLKATSQKDFEAWTNALELAKTSFSPNSPTSLARMDSRGGGPSLARENADEDREWVKVEDLFNRVRDSREAARNLAKDTDPKYLPPHATKVSQLELPPQSRTSSASGSPIDQGFGPEYLPETERKPFWKRRQGGERTMPGMFRRSVSAQSTLASSKSTLSSSSIASPTGPDNQSLPSHAEETLHDHCMTLLRSLDSVVADFAALIAESKQRRSLVPAPTASRLSMESQGSQEFFDADGEPNSQLLAIHRESEDERGGGIDQDLLGTDEEDTPSESDDEDSRRLDRIPTTAQTEDPAFPSKPKSLSPLPLPAVRRRMTVPPSTVTPPSLIGFLRKNVGKELSTISMPVSANEPLSLLQRVSEQLEYSFLLDAAASATRTGPERLLYICAFAISSFSVSRVKERAVRKPFNPMLGETFELVREDRGFRFIAEKISHRPVRMACQAESENWTFTQAPMPTQKFWGKSAELVTEGIIRVTIHSTGERFSWAPAASFLRNIIAGEKYVEPVGTMTVSNETTGEQAIVTFKSKGMFSGRSEDVVVHAFDPQGEPLSPGPGLVGKWTSSLAFHRDSLPPGAADETDVWTAAELVADPAKRYGFTTFAASLNEITSVEKGRLPPTDSRLRPDQRSLEAGDLDTAEEVKGKLEEAQRRRRKVMEETGREWMPRWFEKKKRRIVNGEDGGIVDADGHGHGHGHGHADEEEIWVAKGGKEGYWDCRARGDWGECERVFDM